MVSSRAVGAPAGVARAQVGVGVLRGVHRRVAAEGRDLDDLAGPGADVREPEAAPDDAAVAAEDGADVLRAGARGYVEVLRLAAEEEVTHAAADEVGLVAASLEAPDDLGRVGVDAVLVEGDVVADEPRAEVPLVGGSARAAGSGGGGGARRVFDRVRGQVGRGGKVVVRGLDHRARAVAREGYTLLEVRADGRYPTARRALGAELKTRVPRPAGALQGASRRLVGGAGARGLIDFSGAFAPETRDAAPRPRQPQRVRGGRAARLGRHGEGLRRDRQAESRRPVALKLLDLPPPAARSSSSRERLAGGRVPR